MAATSSTRRPSVVKPPPDPARLARGLAVAGLLGVVVVLAVCSFGQELSFDESYNLQVVQHLLHGHRYATDGLLLPVGDSSEFDWRITTGPTMLLPVTAVAALLGEHVWVYRLVPLAFFLLLVAGWFRLGRDLGGFWVGAAGAAAVLALDTASATWGVSVYFGPGDVMGEAAAAGLVVLAALNLRRPVRAGVLVGLAVLTKTVIVLMVPAVVVGVVWVARRSGVGRRVWLRFAGAALAPIGVWQVYRFAAAGPDRAQAANAKFVGFLIHGGSGIVQPDATTITSWSKLTSQAPLLVPGPAVLALAVVALLLAVLLIGRRLASSAPSEPGAPEAADRAPDRAADRVPVLVLGSAGLLVELWYVLVSSQGWVRHSVTGSFLLFPALVVVTAAYVSKVGAPGRRALLGTATAGLLGVTVGLHLAAALTFDGPDLAAQRRVAERVSEEPGGYMYARHNRMADLMLLGAPDPRPADEGGGLVVLRHDGDSPNIFFDAQLAACSTVVFDLGGYTGCELPPGPVPPALADHPLVAGDQSG
ncbi:MAG TPA: hypothetical protein VFV89_01620 [Nocardioides sp.]|uniref:hypothetical protein n=1 Tax=Nocardioides sp. TaxID=35761 RepID=UPI002E2F4B22|nr:hypothetical protein [Nocardioides sp.]HEX5086473.1 hypothetical protein [Nocardioides sp.]